MLTEDERDGQWLYEYTGEPLICHPFFRFVVSDKGQGSDGWKVARNARCNPASRRSP